MAEAVDADRVKQTLEQETSPRATRSPVYREASVIYESGHKRRGIILDYNETGVRLRFPTRERLPDHLTLEAKALKMVGPVRVVWQDGMEAGLHLLK